MHILLLPSVFLLSSYCIYSPSLCLPLFILLYILLLPSVFLLSF
jgi:hypothetical protein